MMEFITFLSLAYQLVFLPEPAVLRYRALFLN